MERDIDDMASAGGDHQWGVNRSDRMKHAAKVGVQPCRPSVSRGKLVQRAVRNPPHRRCSPEYRCGPVRFPALPPQAAATEFQSLTSQGRASPLKSCRGLRQPAPDCAPQIHNPSRPMEASRAAIAAPMPRPPPGPPPRFSPESAIVTLSSFVVPFLQKLPIKTVS